MDRVSIADNAIVSLGYAKAYLNIQDGDVSQDDFLQAVINSVSSRIEDQTRGAVKLQTFNGDIYDGNGRSKLVTQRKPIAALATVIAQGQPNAGMGDPINLQWRVDVDDTWKTLEANPTHILLDWTSPYKIELWGNTFPIGRQNIKLSAKYGYTTIPGAITEVCLEAVAETFKNSSRGNSRLGMTSFGRSGPGGSSTDSFVALTDAHKKALMPYTWLMC